MPQNTTTMNLNFIYNLTIVHLVLSPLFRRTVATGPVNMVIATLTPFMVDSIVLVDPKNRS